MLKKNPYIWDVAIKEGVLTFLDTIAKRGESRKVDFLARLNMDRSFTGALLNSGVVTLRLAAMGDLATALHSAITKGNWTPSTLLSYARGEASRRIVGLADGGSTNLLDAPHRAAEAAFYTELAGTLDDLGVKDMD